MPIRPARTYDPCNIVRHALKNMRGYNLSPTKTMWEEDVIVDVLSEDLYKEIMVKCRDIVGYEQEVRKVGPSFKGFYPDEEYCASLDKCLDNFDEFMSQAPKEIRKKINIEYSNDEYTREVFDEEDQSEDD